MAPSGHRIGQPDVSDFDVMHKLAALYGALLLADGYAFSSPYVWAFREGGAVGLVAAVRAEMARERAAGEAVAAEAFQRAEDDKR
jgi:hypothetical protein